MPVPTSIADLSKNAADNSPAGTESAKGTIDDYFRAHASFIKQLFDQLLGQSVVLPSAATVNVGFAAATNIIITGTTQISAFDNWPEGTMRWITFAGAMILKHNSGSFQLPGAADLGTSAGDVAVFKSLGSGNWKCMAYQRVSGTGPIKASDQFDGYLSKDDWASFNSRISAASAAATYLPQTGGTLLDFVTMKLPGALGTQRFAFKVTQGSNVIRYIWGLDDDESPVLFTYDTGGLYNGTIKFAGGGVNATGAIIAPTVTETSDGRLKKLWRRLAPDLLQNVAALRKVGTFVWRKGGAMGMGGCAQEIEKFMPWAVVTDENGVKSVRYGAAAFVIVVELTRAFLAHVTKTEKRLAKLEGK